MFIQEAAAWNGEFDIQGPDCHQRCRAPGDEEEIEGTMTTGHDDTGRRDGGPNLLAPLPGDRAAPGSDPAGSEALLTAVLEMREEQARFRKEVREELAGLRNEAQADRPEPVTGDALDAWSGALLEKIGEMVPKETEAGDAMTEHAGRMEAAAERIDAGLERTAKRFSADVAGMEKWLAEDRSAIRASMSGIESAAARIEAGLGEFHKRADSRFNDIASVASDTLRKVRTLQIKWQALLSPWAAVVFIMGIVFANTLKLVDRLL